MGAVYLAERADGHYQQQVALKLIRPGTHATMRVQRFLAERQILARLTHPYIARLLDGGSRTDGQPYLVMEYIQGEPIDTYCRRHGLGLTDRLGLFVKVCEAVAYAHQHKVIHRDLKPGNILVTAEGTPKLLDFGVAKLLVPMGSPQENLTVAGRSPMTPNFAAPEQLQGETVTLATDVYALGLILYELLTDRRAFDGASAHGSTAHTPPRPSRAAARNWRRRLEGDLDNIVQRALAHSPRHRYASAGALADDITRYLTQRPVGASGHALHYRLRRRLYRHRSTLGLTGLAALALFASGLTASLSDDEEIGADRVADTRPITVNSTQGAESPFAESCAALQAQYRENKSRALFERLVRCRLDDAEWHNGRGQYPAALRTLTALVELRRNDYRARLPATVRTQKGRLLAALAQAFAGSGDAERARHYQRRLAVWTRQRGRLINIGEAGPDSWQ